VVNEQRNHVRPFGSATSTYHAVILEAPWAQPSCPISRYGRPIWLNVSAPVPDRNNREWRKEWICWKVYTWRLKLPRAGLSGDHTTNESILLASIRKEFHIDRSSSASSFGGACRFRFLDAMTAKLVKSPQKRELKSRLINCTLSERGGLTRPGWKFYLTDDGWWVGFGCKSERASGKEEGIRILGL
jgi:hypothetical protein